VTILFVLCGMAVPLVALVALMGEGGNADKLMRERLSRRPPESHTAPVAPADRSAAKAAAAPTRVVPVADHGPGVPVHDEAA
jgi:hypothetical protein